ncbi:MAG: hypothetical protein ABH868_02585 [bacterium]
MPKNTKKTIILGVLFAVIIFVYGRNLFPKKSQETGEEIGEYEQSFEDEQFRIPTKPQPRQEKNVPKSWGRDPFVSDEVVFTKKAAFVARERKLFLSGIALKGDRYLAVIDGEVVAVGDLVEGRKIISIEKNRVVLKKNDKIEALKLREEQK